MAELAIYFDISAAFLLHERSSLISYSEADSANLQNFVYYSTNETVCKIKMNLSENTSGFNGPQMGKAKALPICGENT
jgi:hypothetical protein